MDEQNWKIEDVKESKENEEEIIPFEICSRCGKEIELFGKEDNFLGQDPYACKHWCSKCFVKLKEWIKRQKERVRKGR
jgi:DNA-directed RNA polymerase subunit RPC12/RpoP